jgi:phage shock protein E
MFSFLKKLFAGNADELRSFLERGAVVVDVRTPNEFGGGNFKGSKNIPVNLISSRVAEIKKWNKPVIVCCASGMRSGMAKSTLQANGIEVINAGAWTKLTRL